MKYLRLNQQTMNTLISSIENDIKSSYPENYKNKKFDILRCEKKLSLQEINERINNEVCYDTIKKLSDKNLSKEYEKSISVKKKLDKFTEMLSSNHCSERQIKNITKDWIPELIPPGTKGSIRGQKLNEIVKNHIEMLRLPIERFEVNFETDHELNIASERPDWTIYDKQNNNLICGMNQLDFWTGGHQSNRGFSYLNKTGTNCKIVCVICNHINIKSRQNKKYELFNTGYKLNNLCYLNGLKKIIENYFNI